MIQLLLKVFSLSESDSSGKNILSYRRSAHLHLFFLGPLVFTIFILMLLFVVSLYQHVNEEVKTTVLHLQSSAQNYYDDDINDEIHAMRGIIETMRHREDLSAALSRLDRKALLQITEEQFKSLKRHFNITHFYFMDVNRVNLLRVHAPLRFGDTINRSTILQAKATNSIASGIELGILGTFTLRVVAPWYDHQQKLIGYVELGMEIDQILKRLRESQNVQLLTVINKRYLDRDKWINGMRVLGRMHDWEQLQDVVINQNNDLTTPIMLVKFLEREGAIADFAIREMKYKSREFRVLALPLIDASDRNVAQILLTADVTQLKNEALGAVYTIGLVTLALGGVLLVFFNWLIGGISRRLERDEEKLRELAIRDGLTNLYNQRVFYIFLNDEIERACRYQRPVSLLLLDIDHFKGINDNYGHLAGDAILRGLSQRLIGRLRATDRVCRYGGEEITMILPETDVDIAIEVAEDIRHLIEREPFYIGDNQHINITVSIGVAVSPLHAEESSQLVLAADTALYEAKDRGRNHICIYQAKG